MHCTAVTVIEIANKLLQNIVGCTEFSEILY